MTKYTLKLKRSAQKELDGLSDALFARIDAKIMQLEEDSKPQGSVKLVGMKDTWRIRVGDYRVVYIIDDVNKIINITRIAHRKDVYEA